MECRRTKQLRYNGRANATLCSCDEGVESFNPEKRHVGLLEPWSYRS